MAGAFVTPTASSLFSARRARVATPRACAPASSSTSSALSTPPRASVAQHALIFDCDGVIVESEELHRISYNQCWKQNHLRFEWSVPFYEMLQNAVGGGKEKMRWYFDRYGWPMHVAASPHDRQQFIARLHVEKTALYQQLVRDGAATARPGVLRLMDEAHVRGVKLAVCSAANADAVRLVLDTLLGDARLAYLDLVLAGDVVSRKKPHPMIYNLARDTLAVQPHNCVVIEDSQIGLRAALDAHMNVVITHTPYTASQSFEGATAVYASLGDPDTHAPHQLVTIDTLFPRLAPLSSHP
ncbi:unnamed protein product [Agarophyton chilense]|eukprot:gb/GEZJ01001819.1/.p1 GENE.gb/GEZJ01001819.1/~~gb/GEZJ01001819.1/.p1  ORF type:complete len:298 (-),score=50.18 gb/GEZJ01001819.1/:173-1066(-)